MNIGIVWSGIFLALMTYMSIPLKYFEDILKLNANFYSLQYDVREEDKSI